MLLLDEGIELIYMYLYMVLTGFRAGAPIDTLSYLMWTNQLIAF